MSSCVLPSDISIHAPRGGSDDILELVDLDRIVFQSTLPVGGATDVFEPLPIPKAISIHAPRGGSDQTPRKSLLTQQFQSTLPVGGATVRRTKIKPYKKEFQSTLPVGGATYAGQQAGVVVQFQSTLPVGGATSTLSRDLQSSQFQSTLPVGGATQRLTVP